MPFIGRRLHSVPISQRNLFPIMSSLILILAQMKATKMLIYIPRIEIIFQNIVIIIFYNQAKWSHFYSKISFKRLEYPYDTNCSVYNKYSREYHIYNCIYYQINQKLGCVPNRYLNDISFIFAKKIDF